MNRDTIVEVTYGELEDLREQVAALTKELSDMRANHPENACYDAPTWYKLREQIAALQKYGCELDDWNDKLQNQLAAIRSMK